MDYPVVESFKDPKIGAIGSNNFEFLCREEHVRWVREKLNLGWKYGEEGKDYFSIEERNRKKLHKCIVPYECLTEEDKMKDAIMIDNIIPLLKKFGNNIRIYSYRSGRKPDLVVAGIGHRFYKDDEKKLKEAVISILKEFMEENRVIVRTGYAYGADQLIELLQKPRFRFRMKILSNTSVKTLKTIIARILTKTRQDYADFWRKQRYARCLTIFTILSMRRDSIILAKPIK